MRALFSRVPFVWCLVRFDARHVCLLTYNTACGARLAQHRYIPPVSVTSDHTAMHARGCVPPRLHDAEYSCLRRVHATDYSCVKARAR